MSWAFENHLRRIKDRKVAGLIDFDEAHWETTKALIEHITFLEVRIDQLERKQRK